MEAEQPQTAQSSTATSTRPYRGNRRHQPRKSHENSDRTPELSGEQHHGHRSRGRGRGRGGFSHAEAPHTAQRDRAGQGPSRAGTPDQHIADVDSSHHSRSNQPRSGGYRGGRAARFNPTLTAPDARLDDPSANANAQDEDHPSGHTRTEGHVGRHDHRRHKHRPNPNASTLAADDLTSTLIKSLSTRPYPDCPICFSQIHPAQPTWSCSPSIPQVATDGDVNHLTNPQHCWTTFHLKCIRSWAEKSVKDLEEAWRNRGEMDKKGEWRCPGCQARREVVPTSYWCFCNSTPEPKPSRLATPHSCGNSCSRPRESGCGHPCPILCHPGPCPPCQVTIQLPCPCPKRKVVTFRCGSEFSAGKGKGKGREDVISTREGQKPVTVVSCGSVCGRSLGCGMHSCEKICHPGPCSACEAKEEVTCFCGKTKKEVGCGEGHGVLSSVRVTEGKDAGSCLSWIGRFECEGICDRLFDCGIHRCQKPCHRQLMDPAPCPSSPSKITHCPCGKNPIGSPKFPARKSCTDPIPTCDSTCGKVHDLCGHACTVKCHVGPCHPCSVPMIRPCRCGLTTREVKCADIIVSKDGGEKEISCDRPCTALRACGKHECRRLCCPLASLAFGKGKRGRAAFVDSSAAAGFGEEEGGLHECDLVCGKMLSCGNHTCEKRDHKGPCPSCLQSSFEEAICPCGRTIIEPPIPCGTKVNCSYQCPRVPSCGHPPISHSCHEEPPTCPPCVYLTKKLCACGKKEIENVKCSLEREKVSCATSCGRLLSCGFHRCQRLCHAGDCGACTTPCGKDRKLCLPSHHPCTRSCHAPSACPEDDPCQALITLTCSCGRLTQAARCGRSILSSNSSDPASRPPLKCNSQCEVAKRNARLAEALGITAETREKASKGMAGGPVVYPDDVVAFAKEDPKFVSLVEKTFAEFVASNKRSQVLPHMPTEKRKFVQSLASIYRFDAQTVDQEPARSIQIVRRVDTRVPNPLLSAHVASTPNFGKLSLSTSLKPKPSVTPPPVAPVPGMTASGPRGWGSSARTAAVVGGSLTGTGSSAVAAAAVASAPRGSLPPSRSATPQRTSNTGGADAATLAVPDSWEDDT